MRRWEWIAGTVVALACSFDSLAPGNSGSLGGEDGSSGAAETGDDAGSTTATTNTASASGGATTNGSSPTSGSQSTTAGGTTMDPDPTSSPTTGGNETTSDATDSTSGSAMTEHLQNTDQTSCDGPFWCVWYGNVDDPTGGPLEDQECFTATLEPPFDLVEVNYVVYMSAAALGPFDLVVRRRAAGGPGAVIGTIPLAAAPWGDAGMHTLTLEDPISIDAQSFCVGFDADGAGLQSALGIAVDVGSEVIGTTWVDFDSNCSTAGFVDVVATYEGVGEGNWCIDVVIEK